MCVNSKLLRSWCNMTVEGLDGLAMSGLNSAQLHQDWVSKMLEDVLTQLRVPRNTALQELTVTSKAMGGP